MYVNTHNPHYDLTLRIQTHNGLKCLLNYVIFNDALSTSQIMKYLMRRKNKIKFLLLELARTLHDSSFPIYRVYLFMTLYI
jgi:hypothetical protein